MVGREHETGAGSPERSVSRGAPIPLVAGPKTRDRHHSRRAAERQAQSAVLRELAGQVDPAPVLLRLVQAVESVVHMPTGLCLPQQVGGEPGGPVCIAAGGHRPCPPADDRQRTRSCPMAETDHHRVAIPLRHFGRTEGHLWVRPAHRGPLSEHDQQTLATFAELAVFTLAQSAAVRLERHDATLAERDRIARELHDSLAQALGVTHLRLAALQSAAGLRGLPGVQQELTELISVCHEAYTDVREAILGLRESTRVDSTFLLKLQHYTELFARRSGVDAMVVSEVGDEVPLTPHCEAQAFRIMQEALNNVRKHAAATTAILRVEETDDSLCLRLVDDGTGFDTTRAMDEEHSFGLRSMVERAEMVGGTVQIESSPGHGTRVDLTVPKIPGGVRTSGQPEAVGS